MPQIAHVINRGVDKRTIFMDDRDHLRFIHNLHEFNDVRHIKSNYRTFARRNEALCDIECRTGEHEPENRLVELHAFTLMPNHYHLLMSPVVENGIARFMHKLDMGYSKYFDTKYKRVGTLFEGRYKAIPAVNDAHFMHLPYYIHCNPLDLTFPEWRERNMRDHANALLFLETYRWSSHLDYLDKNNFPSATSRSLFSAFFGGAAGYRDKITDWLKEMDDKRLKI